MRYYDIVITNPDGSAYIDQQTGMPWRFRSVNDQGINMPGALNVELDVQTFSFATPAAGSYLKIWGVSLHQISQASNLNGKKIAVLAGMSKGLPLAKPGQSGLLFAGWIQQAFGNWRNTEMSLDLIIQPGEGPVLAPKKLSHVWPKGMAMSDMIRLVLETGFPGYTANIAISPNLVLAADEPGYYANIVQFAQFVKEVSLHIVNDPAYAGVDIILNETTFTAYDGTTKATPKQIAFEDLIGQPTWIQLNTINFQCVMRADIGLGDYVTMPKGQFTTTAASASQYRDRAAQQGTFQTTFIHHLGDFRQADAAAWITSINAVVTA